MKILKKKARGFTLVELLIVISIIGILASITTPNFLRSILKAKETSLRQSLFVFRDVIDQYYSDHGHYPDTLDVLVTEKYIREIPIDPFTKSRDTWILILSDEEGETGIFDVHSGSHLVSSDAGPYNEW